MGNDLAKFHKDHELLLATLDQESWGNLELSFFFSRPDLILLIHDSRTKILPWTSLWSFIKWDPGKPVFCTRLDLLKLRAPCCWTGLLESETRNCFLAGLRAILVKSEFFLRINKKNKKLKKKQNLLSQYLAGVLGILIEFVCWLFDAFELFPKLFKGCNNDFVLAATEPTVEILS